MILGSNIRIADDSAGTILIGRNFGVDLSEGLIAIIANGNAKRVRGRGIIIADNLGELEIDSPGQINIVDDKLYLSGNVFINGTDVSQLVRSMVISTLNDLPSSEE